MQGYEDTKKVLKPIYEMGVVQAKVGITLQNLRNDEIKFKKEKESILDERKNLKLELEKLVKNY
jgi:NTE family protein